MKRTIRKLSALALVLTMVLSMSALAAKETPSKGFRLPGVKPRPTAVPEAPEATAAPEASAAPEATVAPEASAAPEVTVAPENTEMPKVTDMPIEETVIATAYVALENASSSLNVRAAASAQAERVGSLPNGDEVSVLGHENGWTKIRFGGGVGYVLSSYLTAEAPVVNPTEAPAEEPAVEPTEAPAEEPAVEPTEAPAEEPTVEPTEAPTVEIRCVTTGDIYYGDEVTFEAVVDGDVQISNYRWQYSTDNANWQNVSGGNGKTFKLVVTEENVAYYWRVEVDF